MIAPETKTPFIAIACGGTGGHLFPGIAVAEELKKRGCKIALLISPKEIDQQAVKSAKNFQNAKVRRSSGHGRIYQCAANSCREKIRRENIFARVEHYSRTRQPFSRALRGRGVCRISRNRRAFARKKSFRDRHARSPGI